MAQTAYPTGAVPATVTRWARMARVFAPPAIVGTLALNAYGASVSGLTVTIGRGISGVAEAWVRSFFHVLDAADWSVTVPANTNATLARVDRIVLRWDSSTETVVLAHVQGTPAASPVATALVQTDTGVWELPLWRFTVPANSGSPITGLIDDRRFYDPDLGSVTLSALVPTQQGFNVGSAAGSVAPGTTQTEVLIPDQGRPYYLVASLLTTTNVNNSGNGYYLSLFGGPAASQAERASSPVYGAGVQQQVWVRADEVFGPITGPARLAVTGRNATSNASPASGNGTLNYRVVPAN